MRISDWSSDVCSSDLEIEEALHRPLDPREGAVAGVALLFDETGLARKSVNVERLVAFAAIVKEVRRFLVIARQRDQPAAAEIIFGAGVESMLALRSEARRVGKGWVRTCRSRWARIH